MGLFVFPLAAQDRFAIEGQYWIPQMSSSLRVVANGLGADIDGKGDLGLPDTHFPAGAFDWRHGRSLLFFAYTPIEYSADQVVNRTIEFRGRQYTVGTRVVSNLEAPRLQLGWAYQFVNVRDGVFRLGPMVEADGFLMHGTLAAPDLSTPLSEKESVSFGLPAAGLAMNIAPHRMVEIYGRVAGMSVGGYGYYVGSDAGFRVGPWRRVFFTAGYRTLNLSVRDAPDFARLQLRGPFVGLGFRLF